MAIIIKPDEVTLTPDDNLDDILFKCDMTERVAFTNCGDSYMDYAIRFDDILALADFIRKYEKERK